MPHLARGAGQDLGRQLDGGAHMRQPRCWGAHNFRGPRRLASHSLLDRGKGQWSNTASHGGQTAVVKHGQPWSPGQAKGSGQTASRANRPWPALWGIS